MADPSQVQSQDHESAVGSRAGHQTPPQRSPSKVRVSTRAASTPSRYSGDELVMSPRKSPMKSPLTQLPAKTTTTQLSPSRGTKRRPIPLVESSRFKWGKNSREPRGMRRAGRGRATRVPESVGTPEPDTNPSTKRSTKLLSMRNLTLFDTLQQGISGRKSPLGKAEESSDAQETDVDLATSDSDSSSNERLQKFPSAYTEEKPSIEEHKCRRIVRGQKIIQYHRDVSTELMSLQGNELQVAPNKCPLEKWVQGVPDTIQRCDKLLFWCKLCAEKNNKIELLSSFTSTGSSLKRHFTNHHPEVTGVPKSNVGTRLLIDDNGSPCWRECELLGRDSKRQGIHSILVLENMVANNIPFAVSDSAEWKLSYMFADPKLHVNGHTAMRNLLDRIITTKLKPQMVNRLKHFDSLAMVVDAWKSARNQGILGVKVISVDLNMTWHADTLAVTVIEGKHTASTISHIIRNIVLENELSGKIRHIVGDNGKNVVNALNGLEDTGEDIDILQFYVEEFGRSNSSVDSDADGCSSEEASAVSTPTEISFRSICNKMNFCEFTPCVAHTVQLLIRDTINRSELLLALCRKLFSLVSFCNGHQFLKGKITKNSGKGLPVPAMTGWNYIVETAKILVSARRLQNKCLGAAQCQCGTCPIMSMWEAVRLEVNLAHEKSYESSRYKLPALLTNDEFILFTHFVELFEPLCKLTDRAQSDGITSPDLIPWIMDAWTDLHTLREMKHFDKEIENLKRMFPERLRQYCMDPDFQLATLFHPCYKLDFFDDCANSVEIGVTALPIIDIPSDAPPFTPKHIVARKSTRKEGARVTEAKKTKTTDEELIRQTNPPNTGRAQTVVTVLTSELFISSGQEVKDLALDRLSKPCKDKISRSALPVQPKDDTSTKFMKRSAVATEALQLSEFERYLQLGVMTVEEFGNYEKYWNTTKSCQNFPNIKKFVTILYTKPTSSATVERLSSELGIINSMQKSSTRAETMESRVIYRDYLKTRKKCSDFENPSTSVPYVIKEITDALYPDGIDVLIEEHGTS